MNDEKQSEIIVVILWKYANYEIKTNQIIKRMMKKMHMMREIKMMNIKT